MTWLDNFYLSDNITVNRKVLKRKINWNFNVLEYYLIAKSLHNDSVDIIPALEIKTLPERKKKDYVIIGVSSGYHNAKKLMDKITEDAKYDFGQIKEA